MALTDDGLRCPRALQDRLDAAFAVFGDPDAKGVSRSDCSLLFERRRFTGRHDRDSEVPQVDRRSGAQVAFWGRLDNRDEVADVLGLRAGAVAAGMSDAALVAAGWARWGRGLPRRLVGDFAIAVLEPRHRRVFLVRDPMGVKPLYYRIDRGSIAFASTASALKLAGLPLTPDPAWMARYLWMGLSRDVERTAYREVRKLPPGHSLTVEGAGTPGIERWHHWRDDPPAASRRDGKWVEAYRAVLEEAVRCRAESDFPLGIESSGGIDSATILALAAKAVPTATGRMRTFGFALQQDEPALILATSQLWNVPHNYIVTARTAPTDDAVDRTIQAIGYPEEHSNASGHAIFYEEAAHHGVRALFSGFGGDEAVTNGAEKARNELARAGSYGALLETFRGPAVMKPLRLARFLAQNRRPSAYRQNFLAAWRERWPHCLLRDEIAEEYGIQEDFFAGARHDAPFTRVNDVILHYHLDHMAATTRLENCTLAAAAWGLEYRWPLWDVRLVQQYLSTPAIEKLGPGGMGRYLHRRAIDDVVPPSVAWRRSKYMGPPPAPVPRRVLGCGIWGTRAELKETMQPEVEALIDPAKLEAGLDFLDRTPDLSNAAGAIRSSLASIHWLNRWLAADASSA